MDLVHATVHLGLACFLPPTHVDPKSYSLRPGLEDALPLASLLGLSAARSKFVVTEQEFALCNSVRVAQLHQAGF